ncbi:MAG: hypothetical protein KDK70_11795 [Myxococcales bacterium]|nr:hypothetical protein [Myxococcales bacterium]
MVAIGGSEAEARSPEGDPTPPASSTAPRADGPEAEALDPGLDPTLDPTLDVAVSDALVLDPGITCLEHDRLTEQVVTWLGRDELDPRLAVVVEGSPTEPDTLRFILEARGEPIAERVFAPGPSRCQDLHAVVALAIALAIDATVLESVGIATAEPEVVEPRPPKPPAELPPVRVEPPPPEPSPGPDLTPRERPWSLRLHGGGMVTVGVPPPVGGGAELGVELGWRDVLDLQAGVLGASAGPQPIDDATLEITLLAGHVDVCAGPTMGRVRPRFCGGVVAGSAMAEGRGFVRDFQTVVPWVAGVFGGDLRIGLTRRLALSLDLDGLVTVVRPVFDVREELQVRKLRDLPRFGAAFGAGLVVGFGEGRRGARP